MLETRVWSLGREDPLEEEMETHSSILAWKIPWAEEPGELESMGSQKRHNLATKQQQTCASTVTGAGSKMLDHREMSCPRGTDKVMESDLSYYLVS